MNRVLIISGPTASGKTALALHLAKEYSGELISADSRQVYKGMNIVTGKDVVGSFYSIPNLSLQEKVQQALGKNINLGVYIVDTIPLWGVDIVEPDESFDVTTFTTIANATIQDCLLRGKLPILVGGTGFYINWLMYPRPTGGIAPNLVLRQELNNYSVNELQKKLQELNPEKLYSMNQSDRNNPRRLVRAIEIVSSNHNVTPLQQEPHYQMLHVGIRINREELEARIQKRIMKRIDQGAEAEVKALLAKGYNSQLPSMLTIGYKELVDYIEQKLTREEMLYLWKLHEKQYAKRQITWLAKDPSITWFNGENPKYYNAVKMHVQKWLKSS